MKSRRWWSAALVGSLLLCAAAAAALIRREGDAAPWPKTGVFAGYYRQGFETSDFRPAGGKERWWVGFEQGFYSEVRKLPRSCDMEAPCYLVVRGHLSSLGHYGHFGAYNRELRVIEVIEHRSLSSEEKAEVFKGF
jgi:hypothetical protein